MKNRNYLIFLLLTVMITSCKKDKINDYQPNEIITIKGIEERYTKMSLADRITLDPEVSSTDPKAEFEYMWGIYETNVQGYAPKLDTIARTKAIDYLIKQDAKGWVLVFRATNKNTGFSKYVTSDINVTTLFTRGWYVMKDNGNETDLDLFMTPASIVPESKREDVFSLVNGRKLPGKAMLMNYYTNYKSNVGGVFVNTKSLFLITDKDASVVNINTLKEINGFNQMFYQAPGIKAPGFVSDGSQANYFMNNGQLYGFYTMSVNTGQFGQRKLIDESNSPYHLSRYFLTAHSYDPIFFDEVSSSFFSADGSGDALNALVEDEETEMKATHNNKKLLFMGAKSLYPDYHGYAVLQDKTDASLKILTRIKPDPYSFKLVNDTLKTTDKIYHASRYALIDTDENVIYFVTGNQVWSRNLSNKFEQLQYTIPAGEEITFMRHRRNPPFGSLSEQEKPYEYNLIMIGTKTGGNYTVRMFKKTSGNLLPEPLITLKGKGSVGDVMYMAPSMGTDTYPNTY